MAHSFYFKSFSKWLLGVSFLCFASASQALPAHIIILRHAEKISDSDRHLSPEGFARAEALGRYFSSEAFSQVYGIPAIFYAASSAGNSSLRSIETITPAANLLNVPVDSSFDKDDGRLLMEQVLNSDELDGKTVVICWNRKGMSDLMEALTGDFPDRWSDKVFDRFWILDREPNGGYSFMSIPQNL